MTATASLRKGLSDASQRFRLTLCLFACNLVGAALLAVPMATLLETALGRSVAADGLEARFRFGVILDFLRAHQEALDLDFRVLGITALLYIVVASVLTGGVLDALRSAHRAPFLPRFFGGCGRFAFRFLRLLPYLAVGLVAVHWIGRAIDRVIFLAFDQSTHEIAAFWALRGKQGLMLLLLVILAAILDLARILTVLEDRTHMIGALRTAFGFVMRHFVRIISLYAMLLGLGLLLLVAYLLVGHRLLPSTSILGMFLLQQVVMLLRHWFRVAGYAALMALYRGTIGTPVPGLDDETAEGEAPEGEPGLLPAGPSGGLLRRRSGPILGLLALTLAALAAPAAAARPPAEARSTVPPRDDAPSLSRRVVTYRINATLDPEHHRVTGTETILYRNLTGIPMPELKLHLYPNAFANTGSTYVRGVAWDDDVTGARLERLRRVGSWGFMTVSSIRIPGGADLTAGATIEDTVLNVPLPSPVPPGGTARVEIAWETQLPLTLHRMGFWGRHHDIMQWFPKMAVFTDEGWKVYPHYRHSEFFADFGTYEVTLTAPADYLVEATGVPGEPHTNPDGTRSVTFRAHDVHDFAWLADPDALVAREVMADGPYADSPVEILYVHQPHHRRMAPRILAAAREGLRFYGRRFMPYPYPRLIIDDLPMGRSSGMEYPMLFTVSLAGFLPRLYTGPEELTLHEFGHQYWHGIVATNEFEEPWLDEGINTYVTRRARDAVFGSPRPGRTVDALFAYAATRILDEGLELPLWGGFALNLDQLLGFHETPFRPDGGRLLGYPVSAFSLDVPGLDNGGLEESRQEYGEAARSDPMVTPSWGFQPGSYYKIIYSKTDVVLETFSRLLGREAFDEVLRVYVERFRFAHPTSSDFLGVLEEVAGRSRPGLDLKPFIDQLIFGSGKVDFAVTALRSRESRPVQGYIPAGGPGAPPTDRRQPAEARDPTARYETEVIVRRLGEVILPVELVVRFENGEEARERWDGRSTWKRFTYETSSRVERAEVDPENIYVVDLDRTNNGLTIDRQPGPVARLALEWLFWLENYLHLATTMS